MVLLKANIIGYWILGALFGIVLTLLFIYAHLVLASFNGNTISANRLADTSNRKVTDPTFTVDDVFAWLFSTFCAFSMPLVSTEVWPG